MSFFSFWIIKFDAHEHLNFIFKLKAQVYTVSVTLLQNILKDELGRRQSVEVDLGLNDLPELLEECKASPLYASSPALNLYTPRHVTINVKSK